MILENMLLKKNKVLSIAFFLLFTLIPLVIGLIYAFLYSIGMVGALSKGFTLVHWQAVLSAESFRYSLLTSVIIAAMSLGMSTFLALFFTILLEKNPKLGTQNSKLIFYLPLSIPPIIAAFLTFQFLGNSGIVSRFFYAIGWVQNAESFPALVNDTLYIGVIFTQVVMTFPFLTLLFLSLYKTNKINELSLMSKTLGASDSQIRRRVVVPILMQKARPNMLLLFIFLMSSYEIPLLLGRQSPMMLSVLISQKFRKFNLADIPQAYAILVIILVVFVIKNQKSSA
jgi:putative spermidine/putrescine transport system permease protein